MSTNQQTTNNNSGFSYSNMVDLAPQFYHDATFYQNNHPAHIPLDSDLSIDHNLLDFQIELGSRVHQVERDVLEIYHDGTAIEKIQQYFEAIHQVAMKIRIPGVVAVVETKGTGEMTLRWVKVEGA